MFVISLQTVPTTVLDIADIDTSSRVFEQFEKRGGVTCQILQGITFVCAPVGSYEKVDLVVQSLHYRTLES